MAGIWAEVLRLERVGINDNLFELGADSLHVFQITARANKAGIQVTPRQVLQFRTIAAIFEQLASSSQNQAQPPKSGDKAGAAAQVPAGAAARPPGNVDGHYHQTSLCRPGGCDHRESGGNQFNLAFPLSPAQERVWRADRQNPGDPAYNCAFRWSLEGPLDVPVLERAFNEIVCRHEILRATFTQIGVDPVQLIAPSIDLKVVVNDLRGMPEAERESETDRICREEATRGFDIGTGPLIRVRLIQTGRATPLSAAHAASSDCRWLVDPRHHGGVTETL